MRLVFAGTPALAATSLQALLNSEHEIVAVYTQPDRPAGRGRQLTPSPVKELALAHKIKVYQPDSWRDGAEQQTLAALEPDLMIVVAYGMLLPQTVLAIPSLGCWNAHFSLLPRWRGAAPIARAMVAGDAKTGVTIMQMAAGLDTGDILLQHTCGIGKTDTGASLTSQLSDMAAQALLQAIKLQQSGQLLPVPQIESQASYAAKLTKDEAVINWHEPAEIIARKIRAYNPWPVATAWWDDVRVRVWHATSSNIAVTQAPGTVLDASKEKVTVATGAGVLLLEQIQLPGKTVVPAVSLVNHSKKRLQAGVVFHDKASNCN